MRKGDILLVDYRYDPIGWLIKWVTKSKYNHVAWALNEFVVIEATGRGIKTTALSKYLNCPLYSIKLIRFKDLCKTKIKKISKRLVKQQCKTPYWRFLLSYILVWIGIKPLVKNCSNFIYFELRQEGHSLGKKNKKFINPEDFHSYKYSLDITEELPSGVKHIWKNFQF
jgi:hypothetical protein